MSLGPWVLISVGGYAVTGAIVARWALLIVVKSERMKWRKKSHRMPAADLEKYIMNEARVAAYVVGLTWPLVMFMLAFVKPIIKFIENPVIKDQKRYEARLKAANDMHITWKTALAGMPTESPAHSHLKLLVAEAEAEIDRIKNER